MGMTRSNLAEEAERLARRVATHWAALAACAAMVCTLLAFAMPRQAVAEVLRGDVIAGSTVEERGLSVADCPSVDATHAVLVDADGNVFFARDAESPSQIASITKVMTAMVAIDKATEGTFIVVSEEAATIGESSANLQQGDTMNLETALKALLVPSGNDAALAIAQTVGSQMIAADESLGDDPVAAFAQAMNEKAAEIGCTDTVYENPHGLDDGEYAGDLHGTALDQAKVARSAMQYPLIREIVSGGSTTITVDRGGAKEQVELETTDELLEMYDAAIGIKTGMTDLAGPSFMGAAEQDGRDFYAIVLGSTDETQRFRDAYNMFTWAYSHIRELQLANSETTVHMSAGNVNEDVQVVAEISHADWIDKTVPATLSDPDAKLSVFDLEGNVSQVFEYDELHGTVQAGAKVGKATFKQQNEVVAEYDLVACETVEAPNPIDAIGVWWTRMTGGGDKAETRTLNVMPIINNKKTNAA